MAANTTQWPLLGFRAMFYLITRAESSYESDKDVPDYVEEATTFFFLFIVAEHVYLLLKPGKTKIRINAGLSSISAGLFMRLMHVIMKNWEMRSYTWFHEHYHVVSLPWDSAWTWWLCFFAVDMMYYWFHRMAHEVNFMWAAHQVHHSSEDYNLATSLRQSAFQQCSSWLFYLPLALFIPTPMFIAHIQFNLLYQFWIHTEVIGKLGPLEWVLNTASHHRVHHGRNRYCIDKNYAGTLIIWDRIFGTFEPESERVVYGLTHTVESFNPIYIQLCHFMYMWDLLKNANSWSERFNIMFKGPGWGIGKPRLGLIEDIPDVHYPVSKYNPKPSKWQEIFMVINLLMTIGCFQQFYARKDDFGSVMVILFTLYVLLSLTAIGATLDNKSEAPYLHFISSVIFLGGLHVAGSALFTSQSLVLLRGLKLYASLSTFLWAGNSFLTYNQSSKKAE